MRSFYCFIEDGEGHRRPAFDSDIVLFAGEEGLARLRESSEQCANEHPDLSCVIVDDDWEVVDVSGRLVREQYDSIDWDEVKDQERQSAFPEEKEMAHLEDLEDPPVPY